MGNCVSQPDKHESIATLTRQLAEARAERDAVLERLAVTHHEHCKVSVELAEAQVAFRSISQLLSYGMNTPRHEEAKAIAGAHAAAMGTEKMTDSEIAAIRSWLAHDRHCQLPCACYRDPQPHDCQSSALSLAKAIEKARPAQKPDMGTT